MEQEFLEESGKSLGDYIALVKRRKKVIIITAILVLILTAIAIFVWPPTYRSQAVILIEEQDVPTDLVQTTITSYAVQRIEEIKQRIMTTSNIMSIVERFELYSAKELKRLTRTEIALEFRKNVNIAPISAEVVDPRSGRPTEAVIAFSLSFKGEQGSRVHKVTNELVTLFLNANLKERTEQSASTSEFLTAEVRSLSEQLKSYEQKISKFKEENRDSLPELNTYNMNIIDRGQQELLEIQTRMQDLETRKINLESRLTQLSPSAPSVLPTGETVMGEADRLKALKNEYAYKKSLYTEGHPDLVRLKRELDAHALSGDDILSQNEINQQRLDIERQLAEATDKYSPDHPEIQALMRQQESLSMQSEKVKVRPFEVTPDNPSYILVATQIESTNSEINALKEKSKALREKIQRYESFLLKAPSVEKEYLALLRDYDNTRLKYREIKAKQMTAELSQSLEQERKGERFTLIQPPEIPEEPISPNRKALILVGFILCLGIGIGSGVLVEALDPKVYGEKALFKATNLEAMISIPYISSEKEQKNSKRTPYIVLGVLIILIILSLLAFHTFVKPLDVTWYILQRKLGLN